MKTNAEWAEEWTDLAEEFEAVAESAEKTAREMRDRAVVARRKALDYGNRSTPVESES